MFVQGHGVRSSRTIGHTHITRPSVPISSCFIVLSWFVSVKCEMSMRKLGRGEEKEVKKMHNDRKDNSLEFWG